MNEYFESACLAVDRPAPAIHAEADVFWSKDDPSLEELPTGQLKVKRGGMWQHQRDWWELDSFVKVLVGGYGAGKTLILSKRMIAVALENAPCPVACVSPTYAVARQTTVATIASLLTGKRSIYGRSFWWRYNHSSHEFVIRFRGRNARIIIYSGDNPLSLRGPNLAAAGIDEPFIQDVEVFKQMIARVRHPDAIKHEINITGTPEQLNWGYDLCVGEDRERFNADYIIASTRLNKAIGSAYVGRMEGAFSDKEAQAYIDGQFVSLGSGLVYHAFDPSLSFVEMKMPAYAELGVGMDFNVNPMSACVFWKANNHVHFFDEIELPNADTEFLCSILRERYVDPMKPGSKLEWIYPDASGSARASNAPGGKTDFHYIREAGFKIDAPPANGPRRDRYNAANGKFKPRQGVTTLTIDPTCKKLRKYLQQYSYEQMNKQKGMSHLLDAFSYPIVRLFPADKGAISDSRLSGF